MVNKNVNAVGMGIGLACIYPIFVLMMALLIPYGALVVAGIYLLVGFFFILLGLSRKSVNNARLIMGMALLALGIATIIGVLTNLIYVQVLLAMV